MKLKKLSRYFYRHPKVLFNSAFVFSAALHAAMLIQMPFLKFTSLPAKKAKMTIINVSLQEIKVHSKTNVLKKKEEKPKEKKKEMVKEIVKKEEKFIPPPPSISKDIIIKARETYEDKILKRINAMKHYPMQARRTNQEGVVMVRFTLKRNGTLKGNVAIVKKCRYEVLNKAAVKTIVRANPYPLFPNEIKKNEISFVIDVDFHLEVW